MICPQRPAFKGFLELFVLAECNRAPTSGKQAMAALKSITRGKWTPGPGAIYPLLAKLEKKGFLKPVLADGGGRREILYSLTASGRRFLAEKKKKFCEEVTRLMSAAWPLMMRIMHNADEESMAEIEEHFKTMERFKNTLFSMPRAKRKVLLNRFSKSVDSLAKEMQQ